MTKLLVSLRLKCRVHREITREQVIQEVKDIFMCDDFVTSDLIEGTDKHEDGTMLVVNAINVNFTAANGGAERVAEAVVFAEMAAALLQKHPEGSASFLARKFDESYGEPIHEFTSGIVVVGAPPPLEAKEEAVPAETVTA